MKFLLLLCGLSLSVSTIFSQAVNKNMPNDDQKLTSATKLYDRYNSENQPIFNGFEYVPYTMRMQGKPWLASDSFARGWISYMGKIYDPASLIYDISRTQVVMYDDHRSIVLHNEYIDSFYVPDHLVITLTANPAKNLHTGGYYEVLVRGKILLLAKRVIEPKDMVEGDSLVRFFTPKDRFYIYKDGTYTSVGNENDLLQCLSDKRRELKTFIRQNHMGMQRKNFEPSLVKVTAYYDHLIE